MSKKDYFLKDSLFIAAGGRLVISWDCEQEQLLLAYGQEGNFGVMEYFCISLVVMFVQLYKLTKNHWCVDYDGYVFILFKLYFDKIVKNKVSLLRKGKLQVMKIYLQYNLKRPCIWNIWRTTNQWGFF